MKFSLITRRRHERELEMLRLAYSVSTTDLRTQLQSLIQKFSMVVDYRNGKSNDIEVLTKIRVPKSGFYDRFFSPAEKEELFWHIAQRITAEIKMQMRSVSLQNDQREWEK